MEDLYRASPRIPTMKDVTRDNLIASLKGLADWIADNQTSPDGRYIYRYFPTKDEENDEYNIVRHALGPFSMALAQQYAPNPKYREKAEAGMKFLESHIRWGGPPRRDDGTIDKKLETWMGKPLPGEDVALVEFAEPGTKQMSLVDDRYKQWQYYENQNRTHNRRQYEKVEENMNDYGKKQPWNKIDEAI